MATIYIKPADPKDVLPYNVIRIPCKKCKKSLLHDRIVRDAWLTKGWRKPLTRHVQAEQKGYWACRKCGNVARF